MTKIFVLIRRLFPVILLLVLAGGLAWYLIDCKCLNYRSLSPFSIRNFIQSFGVYAAVVYIIAYVFNTISVFPPIAPLSLTAGLAFGSLRGGMYLMLGALLGTSATFFLSRYIGRRWVEKALKGKIMDFDAKLRKNGFLTVLFFRAVPLLPYELMNYGCGLTSIRFRDYFFGTFLGLIPGVTIASLLGGSLGDIKSFKDLLAPKLLIALGLMGLVILIPVFYKLIQWNKVSKKEKKVIP